MWKPIDTVPLGENVLLYDGERVRMCAVYNDNYPAYPNYRRLVPAGVDGWEWDFDLRFEDATHWAPCPLPP